MAALQRHEIEKFCIDQKKIFFGCTLDGNSAFEVVNRTILTRELYCAGEKGQFWLASKFSYQNTKTKIKMDGKLSREISETLGVKQGNIKSSDNYKIYANPLLDTLDSANLGVLLGPINCGFSSCADDLHLMTDTQSKMQALLDIASHYAKMYKVSFGVDKTKITVIGSMSDMTYYSDVSPWVLDGEKVKVSLDNEHLGQIVSGVEQEQKNIDLRIQKGRNNIFGLLGPAFSFKCLLSPSVKIHLFRTYTSPILQNGLSSFALRTSMLELLAFFHRKTLRGILNLSRYSTTPALHFLLGELPIEGKIHRDSFSLFYSIWRNPDSKIYSIVKYLLETTKTNSRTWAAHIRYLSVKYDIPDPLQCLNSDPPPKSYYKEFIHTKISAYFEKYMRDKASQSSCMQYLNVSLTGLRGKNHPVLLGLVTTHEVKKAKIHIKMLAGDFLTYQIKADRSGGSPLCRSCPETAPENENLAHILTQCYAYLDIRERIFPEYSNVCKATKSEICFEDILRRQDSLCQFILDPTSLNLEERVNIKDPALPDLLKISRDYCYAINSRRMNIINSKKK